MNKLERAAVIGLIASTLIAGAELTSQATVDPWNPNPAPTDIRCYEDSVKVFVVAQVLPDNGVEPGLDWGTGDLTGQLFCVPADDLYTLD